MRALAPFVLFSLLAGCGEKDDRPPAADGCDPAVMDCHMPPMSGGTPDNQGGSGGSGGTPTSAVTGDVRQYSDDDFDSGSLFEGNAQVSARGQSTARVQASYDGASFRLNAVAKEASNWFLVVPAEGSGMVPTITPIDTRTKTDLSIGLVSQALVDSIYQLSLSPSEPDAQRAQIVLRVVDAKAVAIPDVEVSATAELVAYRNGDAWLSDPPGTDGSGLLFLGNIPAGNDLASVNLNLFGAVEARVEVRIRAGATTVVNAVVTEP